MNVLDRNCALQPVMPSQRHHGRRASGLGSGGLGALRARRSALPCQASRCERISASWVRSSATKAVGLGVLRHRFGRCRGGREHAVKLDGLDRP